LKDKNVKRTSETYKINFLLDSIKMKLKAIIKWRR